MAPSLPVTLAALFLAANLVAAAPDPHWSDRFAAPGIDGSITCATTYRDGIAIGGRFSSVSGMPAHNVAWWDGATWHALGSGTDGEVTSLIEFGDQLIVTGHFTNAGGTPSRGAATWSQDSWQAMGAGLEALQSGPPTGARALAIFRGEVFAAGDFEHTGPTPIRHVARWDGTAWRDVGGGTDYGSATSFAVLNNRLYLGGGFAHVGGVPANGVAQWDGVEWRALGDGLRRLGQAAPVLSLAVFDNAIAAGGDFDSAGTVAAKNIAVWKDFAWHALGEGNAGPVRALAVLGTNPGPDARLLVGSTNEAHSREWNPTTGWEDPIPYGPLGVVNGYLYAGGLVAYGDVYTFAGSSRGPSALGLLRESGSEWRGFDTFNQRTNGIEPWGRINAIARVPGGVLVGGSFSKVASPTGWIPADRLARWDGAGWHALPSLPFSGQVDALLAHGDTLDVGGAFFDDAQGRVTPVLRLVNSTWTPLDTLSFSAYAMRFYRGDLVIGGQRVSAVDYPDMGGAYRWDGTRWISLGTFADHTEFKSVHAMAELDGRLIAGGGFDSIDGVAANSIAAWDGSTWSPLGTGPGRGGDYLAIYALAVYRGRLVASGSFGNQSPGVESWTGLNWKPLGSRWGNAYALAASDSELFAGFGRDHLSLDRWNGVSWEELGTTPEGMVGSLLVDDASIYVGGQFTQFGGQAAGGFTRWDRLGTPPPAGTSLASGRPNPFRETIAFTYEVRVPGPLHLLVQDVTGRRVAIVESNALSAGPGQVVWDGRDDAGRKAPAGVYFATLATADGGRDTRKVVLLP